MGNENNRENDNEKSDVGAEGLCTRVPITNPSNLSRSLRTSIPLPSSVATLEQIRKELSPGYCVTDTGHIFANEEERNLYISQERMFEQTDNYYRKYKNELRLSFTKSSVSQKEARKELHKFINKLYEKMYGRHRAKYVQQDFYAVLEFKDKNKQTTRPHWHVLLALPVKEKNQKLTGALVSKIWKGGESWVRDEEMTDPHLYIMDYLTKNAGSYHYLGEN